MRLAIEEAKISLGEDNFGFGSVIVKNGELIAKAHDTEKTGADPTAHAEMTAIRAASARLGRDLSGCVIISTHEPCPMCSTAVLWSGISELAYGYSIKEALGQGRKRLDISCREIFARAGKDVIIHDGILHSECSVLYNKTVRDSIDKLRGAEETTLETLAEELSQKRQQWFFRNCQSLEKSTGEKAVDIAYQVLLKKLGITEDQAFIVRRDERTLVFHSRNFCPTLEACKILGLDTRFVCRRLTEKPMNDLIRHIHPKLRFTRNYDKLRPHSDYCEEVIYLSD